MNISHNDITKTADIKILNLDEQNKLAYSRHHSLEKNAPTVVFLGGFMSDMEGAKALHLHEFCKQKNIILYALIILDMANPQVISLMEQFLCGLITPSK